VPSRLANPAARIEIDAGRSTTSVAEKVGVEVILLGVLLGLLLLVLMVGSGGDVASVTLIS
jgi:hypothetical protein